MKSVIALIIDNDVFEEEAETELTPELLLELGGQVNADAAGICGYEGWMTTPDCPQEIIDALWSRATRYPEGG